MKQAITRAGDNSESQEIPDGPLKIRITDAIPNKNAPYKRLRSAVLSLAAAIRNGEFESAMPGPA
jgi:hypothetical protein